jgi:AraC-like DNA-binding protein
MERTSFSRFFGSKAGISFTQWLRKIRIDQAVGNGLDEDLAKNRTLNTKRLRILRMAGASFITLHES